ncbi:S8 family serine peptidase [bacterium]|nr:S8 family serine peptidase [bacterium]
MKKVIMLVTILTVFLTLSADKFVKDVFEDNNIMVSFKMESIGNMDGTIPVSYENGIVKTHMESFNDFASDYEVIEIKQDNPDIKHKEFNDNGTYIQCLYKITIKDNNRIEQALNSIRKNDHVLWADYVTINYLKYSPNDAMYSQLWYITKTETNEVWDFVRDASDVLIAITDSGIKWNHPDLRENIWINPAESAGANINWDAGTFTGNGSDDDYNGKVDDLMGWDFYNNDNNPMQNWANNYHGTHVAGCASAEGDNGIGTVGPAFNAKLLNCKGASNNSDSDGISAGYQQITYAADMGADIINASWGGQAYNLNYANTYINYATNYGSLVVAAAGNGNQLHSAAYIDAPADCPNAFNVAATAQNDTKADFSDYGEPIDISAPGVGILSTVIENNGWGSAQGTSMASPIVAGIAALVKAVHPELTPATLRQRIENTADYIDDINPGYEGLLGSGRINAYAAVLYDLVPRITIVEQELTELYGDNDGIPNPGETVNLKLKLTNHQDLSTGISWANSTNTTITLRSNHPGVVIEDSTATIGNVFAGSFVWNDDAPFKFSTTSDITTDPIEFTLFVQSNQDQEIPYNKEIPFTLSLSLEYPNWPFPLTGQTQSTPMILDINGNGLGEVIFGDLSGNLNVLDSNNEQINGFPVNTGAIVTLPVAAGDLNNDGNLNLFVVNNNKEAIAYNNDGSILFGPISLDNQITRAAPMISDVNGDGILDAVVCTMNGKLHIFNSDGSQHAGYPVEFPGNFVFNAALADINQNGRNEIILQTIAGNLLVIDYQTQQNIAGFPYTLGSNTEAAPLIADVDNDGYPEIITTVSSQGIIHVVNHDGSLAVSHSINKIIKQDVLAYDFTGNGSKELLFTTYDGFFYAIDFAGNNIANFPINIGTFIEGNMILSNLDNDGICAIFGDSQGKLHAIKANGTQAANFPINFNDNLKFSPAIGDVDGNGNINLAVSNITAMNLIDLKRPAFSPWIMHRGNPGRTGDMFEAMTDNEESDVALVNNALLGNYPNPFNPETRIAFSTKNNGHVSIDIYNLKGQKVKSLLNENKEAGKHTVVWNGKDDNGKNVASGVFFYRMKSGKYTSTKKMILMK